MSNMDLIEIAIEDIHPYERNPRKNDDAVKAVMESIRECEYISPIIVDENHVVLAGHTRLKALKKLRYKSVPCVVKEGLSEEQKRKYRILDNKTNELSTWDLDLLRDELDGLDFSEFDIDWGLPEERPDEKESEESVSAASNFNYSEQYGVIVMCQDESEQEETYNNLIAAGYDCKVVAV